MFGHYVIVCVLRCVAFLTFVGDNFRDFPDFPDFPDSPDFPDIPDFRSVRTHCVALLTFLTFAVYVRDPLAATGRKLGLRGP